MSSGLDILVVDDERPALEDLGRLLRSLQRVGMVETASNGDEALRRLSEQSFDAVLVDVRMPGLDGVELARVLRRFSSPPALIFVSAYETAAVDAFELEAIDYLMKPVSRARIEQALERVAAPADDSHASANGARVAGSPDDVVPVDVPRGGTRLLPRSSILYLQARGDYVRIVADDGRFLLRGRISDIERRWAPFGFVRVHRGFVANLRRAVEVRPQLNGTAKLLFPGGDEVPVARRKLVELRRILSG
jgi:two-component system, LytTR family, response regulator